MSRFPMSNSANQPDGLSVLPARSISEQLLLLLQFSETLAAATTVEQISAAVDEVACHFLGAIYGSVAVVDRGAGTVRFLSLRRLPDSLQSTRRTAELDSPRPAAVVARERRALFVSSLAAAAQVMDEDSLVAARASGGQAFAYVPLLLDGQTVGALALAWAQELDFDEDTRRLLGALARYTAQAVDRAQLLAERRAVAHTLQAALLPVLPILPWLPMRGFYRPAGTADLVGGDWYDAFVSVAADGQRGATVTAVVGDVTGHDTDAAAEMGRLQAKLRALAIDHPDEPDALMQRLDRVMLANVHNRMATAVVANLTPSADGSVIFSWCNAGHLPPLVIESANGEPRYLIRPADPPLGLHPGVRRRRHSIALPPGSTVVMYTDGLIERRDRDLDDGLQALEHAAAARHTEDLATFVQALADDLLTTDPEDDTVIFAMRAPH